MGDKLTDFCFMVHLLLRLVLRPFFSVDTLETLCRAEIAKRPTAYLPRYFLADLYKDYQRNHDAKREYMELARLGKLKASDRLNFGEVLYRLKDYRGVIDTISPLIDRYSRKKDSNWYLGISYIEMGELSRGAEYLKRAIDAGIRRAEDYWRLAVCYDRLSRLDEAVEAYCKALSMKPDTQELKDNLASVYFRQGQSLLDRDNERAVQLFRRALEMDPRNTAVIRALAALDRTDG